MGTQTYTVAQAQQMAGSGLTVADTAANIASAIGSSLVVRVSLFTLLGGDAIDAYHAEALSTLGSKFSRGGYSLVIRDNVASLTNAGNVAGVALGTSVQVLDTAANILAAANNPVIHAAGAISLTANSTLTLTQLLLLETWPSFTAAGTVITLADSAANLLALTPAQAKPALQVYQVAINSTVSAANAATLAALPGFSIANGATLTVADTLANVATLAAAHATLAANQAVTLAVSDSVANLTAGAATLASLGGTAHSVAVTLSASASASASQLAILIGLPHFSAGAGHVLTIADTAQNLLTLSPTQLALAQATTLTASATTTVAQLQQLIALPNFTAGSGHLLSVSDTLADLAGLTVGQHAMLSGIIINDTVAHLIAASPSALSGVTAVTAELDGGNYTIAQLAPLATLAGEHLLTLVATGGITALHVVDTSQNLAAGSAELTALESAGTVTTSSLNDHAILTAAAAAAMVATPGFDATQYTLAVSDTGAAIAAVAGSIFQHGFEAITVTSGLLAGTLAELLDPTLHFAASGSGSAQLSGDATATVAQLVSLAALPNFSVADGTTLTVRDTVSALTAQQSLVVPFAAAIQVTDTAVATAAEAEQLAMERAAVGVGHFSFGGNFLLVSDTAANLTDPANSAGLALANAITLSGDSRVSAAGASQLVAMGANFAPGDALVIVFDTAANLAALASNPMALATVNGWGAVAMLSADATLSVANAQPLAGLSGFTAGSHHLTISDTAGSLLAPANAPVLGLAYTVQLDAAATLSVADATTLTALHGFSTGGMALTVADTAAHLLAMPANLAAIAAGEVLLPQTAGNSADYLLSGTQLATLLTLPNLNTNSFTGQIILADPAATLLTEATVLSRLPAGLTGLVVPALSADAVVTASQAEALHALAGFTRDGYHLTITDTVLNIAGLDAGTRAMATDIQVVGGGSGFYTAAEFLTLSQASNFAGSGQVAVSDTGIALQALVSLSPSALLHMSGVSVLAGNPLSAAQAQALTVLPNLQAGNSVAIQDNVANLLHVTGAGTQPDDWAGEQLAAQVTLSADATITAAQALQLAQLGYRFGNGGHVLTVQDTPTALLAAVSGLAGISNQISATLLAPNGSAWVLSLASASQLATLPNFGVGPAGGIIADSVYNILAPANAAIIAGVRGLALDASATVSVADAQALHALANFSLGTHGAGIANQLTISDGAGHLATLDAGTAALASSIQLQGNAIVSVAQFLAVTALPNYTDNGKLLLVSDTALNLLSLSSSNISQASALMLSSNATLSAAQAQALTALPGFTSGISHIGVLDTAADLLHVTGAGPMPDDWNGELVASTVTLSQDATVSASQAAELALLGSRFSAGGHVLTVSDSAAALTAAANAPGLALAGAITLGGPETLSAANATRLAAISGLGKAGHTVTVTDTAANLAFAGYAAGVALADSVQLGSATSLTVAAAEALIGMANFAANAAAPLTIVDTLPDLLGLAGASLANHTALLRATPIALSVDTVATVAQMTALAALPEYALFSRNGHTLTIADSGRHLATYTPDSIAVPTAYVMTGDATLTAAQADTLAARSVGLGDNTLTIADTPAALLNAGNAAGLTLAGALVLSGNATVDAATAEALAGTANFATGGHLLMISDTAQALLATDAATQQMASSLALSDSEVVDVATLLGLTRFGIKFNAAGHTLAVADTAAQLATLNSLETALSSAQVLSTNATVSAAVAEQLAGLPSFTVGNGVALVVQDSVANLLTLPALVQAIATREQLAPGSHVTVTAADAAMLAALPHFSAAGATIIVNDTIAALNNAANAGWHSVYTQYDVTDSVSNLVANATSPLLTGAAMVELLGDTQVDVATLTTLIAIPAFAPGNMVLTVADGPLQIISQAEAIIASATMARVTTETPLTAADAQVLAALQDVGKLSFASGIHVLVEDSYAALTAPANAEGIALAAGIAVLDTAQNLVLAAAHNWGSQSPFYILDSDGTVTSGEATSLAALGNHFLLNDYALTVTDDAAGAAGSAAVLTALGATVLVTDSIAQVDTNSAGLIALGALLQGVSLTDTSPVTAVAAAGLSGLADKLGGQPVQVADLAAAVDANLTDLRTLGAHLAAVQVTDTAAHVAAVAAGLAMLGGVLTVALADAAPVTATAAAGLVPVLAELAHGSMIDVSDTGATVATAEAALQQLGAVIGTITLSDGTTTTAAIAAALQPLDSHLGLGVQLLVHDSAADIIAAAGSLIALQADGRLAGMVAVNETAADVVSEWFGLALIGAHVQIVDSAAAVSASLDGLQDFLNGNGHLDSITLNDGGSPSVAVSVAQLSADAGVLAHVSDPLTVSDHAATLQADLISGDSMLLAALSRIGAIVASDGGTLSLTAAQLLVPQVDDGPNAALAKFSGGSIAAIDVAVGDIAAIAARGVVPATIAVVDAVAAIQADLDSGASVLLNWHDLVTTLTAQGGALTLTATEILRAGVDDGAGALLTKLCDTSLAVTGAAIAQLDALVGLTVAPTAVAVSDSAAHLQADLSGLSPTILAHPGLVSVIALSDGGAPTLALDAAALIRGDTVLTLIDTPYQLAIEDSAANLQAALLLPDSPILSHLADIAGIVATGTITLTADEVTRPGIDDGAGSVLGKMTGETLVVTDVHATDVAAILALPVAPTSITVVDTAAGIAADLVLADSQLVAHHPSITAIVVNDGGTLHLTEAQALVAGVDDGAGSVLSLLVAPKLDVTNVAAADVARVAALPVAPTSIEVSDTAAGIQADLVSGHSGLLANPTPIGGITVTDSGTITLTSGQALTAGVDDGAGSVFARMTGGSLAVTRVSVGQLSAVAGLPVPPVSILMSDTAAHIRADLTGGGSVILTTLPHVNGIAVSDAGSISLTETQVQALHVDDGVGSVFSLISGGSLTVTNVLAADAGHIATLPYAPSHVLVVDSAADIATDLTGADSKLLRNLGSIDSITVNDGQPVVLTMGEIQAPDMGAALAKLVGSVVADDVNVDQISTVLGLGLTIASIAVADAAGNIEADLISGSSQILRYLPQISGIAAPSGVITLTVAEATAATVDDGPGSAMAKLSGATLAISDATVADLQSLMALQVEPDAIAVSGTASDIQADLASGSSHILAALSRISGIGVSDHNTIELTAAQVIMSGVDDGARSAMAKMTGGSLTVTGVDVASLQVIATLNVPPAAIEVSDTAAHIQADLTGSAQLVAHGGLLTDVHVNDAGTITLSVAEIRAAGVDDSGTAALAHLSGGSLTVTGAAVADLPRLTALRTVPTQINISDTAADVQADLISGTQLTNHSGLLGSIALSDAGTIALTGAQVQAAGVAGVLADLSNGALEITGVAVANVAAMALLTGIRGSVAVLDSSGAITGDLAGAGVLAAHVAAISSVAVSDALVTVATAEALYDRLAVASLHFDETALTISDTSTALLAAASSHATMLSAAHSVILGSDALGLDAVDATALAGVLASRLNGHQLTIVDSAAHLLDPANTAGIALATSVALDTGILTGAQYATRLAGLHNFDAGAQTIVVQDTPARLVDPANAAGLAIASSVAPNADCSVDAATLILLVAIAGFTDGGHHITLQDTAANVAALNQPAFAWIFQTHVSDSAANISANLDALQAALPGHGHALTISVAGAVVDVPVITVDVATYVADQATLDAVDTAGIVRVTGSAAALSAHSATLSADAAVGQVDVVDSATNILTNLPALNAIGSKFSAATVSDATVSAAMVAGLLTIPHLQAGGLVVSDTGAQIAAAIAANGAAGVSFLNSQMVELSQDSVIAASDALALESLTNLNKNGHLLSVWDTATHLTDSIDGYLAAVKAGIIDHVYLRTTSGTVTITASTASSLFSISGFNKNNPDNSVNVLTVQDTAAHIESVFASLNGHRSSLSHVVISGSSTVTDAVFNDLLTLGATAAGGVNVTVRDSAANIIAGASSQIAGTPSITPSAWMLSGSATVSEAGIAFLGGLTGFSAGAYTLTLSADATISVADANAIGSLGTAFRLGTHHLYVAGAVADMAGLGAAAQSIVVPQITDSFANIAGLLPSSGLLGGTISVTDNEAVTVAQAAAFLALLKIGNGSGIPAANVSFAGHVETVTDTLAHIQTLTGAAAWTQNASMQGDFSLVVADTVAHLTDPANTTALSAMAGTTLSGDQTTTAANAESLFAVKTAIHFGLDGHLLTVQDNAANLLDPVNIDGVGMASVLLLSGPSTVAVADAEALLAMATFQLNTTLTVSDSSDALLDGALAGAIHAIPIASQANVHVELAAAEVLDAQTAQALVNLPGYNDNNHDLAIQDSASYLLNPANHAAEVAATSVTLVGDETVSAATAAALAAVPNFELATSVLHLASDDYANAATLKTIADFGTGFDANGHTLTMTQDAIALTPNEYTALQADGLVGNGHALSAVPGSLSVTATGGSIQVDGTGVDTATVTLYGGDGHVLTTTGAAPLFTVTAADAGVNMALTETVGGTAATGESAPVVLLEQASLEGIVSSDSTSFAASGAVHVAGSEYLDIYSAAAAPLHPTSPVLVYDATQHTLSLDVDGHAGVVLVTLGGATTAAALDASEILVKHQA